MVGIVEYGADSFPGEEGEREPTQIDRGAGLRRGALEVVDSAQGHGGNVDHAGQFGDVAPVESHRQLPESPGRRRRQKGEAQAGAQRHRSAQHDAGQESSLHGPVIVHPGTDFHRFRLVAEARLRGLDWVPYAARVRIDQILVSGVPAFSFEFFPPKTDKGSANLLQTIEDLKALGPSFVSVTYGAMGSNRGQVVELVRQIKNDLGVEAMAHLSCTGHTREELEGVLDQLGGVGIENVLALRGDPPKGEEFRPVPGGFAHASDLAAMIRERGSFCVGGAAYPEVHPDAPDVETDLANLVTKVRAGVAFLITQLFFSNADYFDFVARARAAGIEVPIVPGIMPITDVGQVKRFTAMCGARIPAELLSALEEADGDAEAVLQIGVDHAVAQCRELLAKGAPGAHFYTLNRSPATRRILTALL